MIIIIVILIVIVIIIVIVIVIIIMIIIMIQMIIIMLERRALARRLLLASDAEAVASLAAAPCLFATPDGAPRYTLICIHLSLSLYIYIYIYMYVHPHLAFFVQTCCRARLKEDMQACHEASRGYHEAKFLYKAIMRRRGASMRLSCG